MVAFRFEAVDGLGKVTRGVVEADNVRLARSKLRDRQLTPVRVDTLQDTKALGLMIFQPNVSISKVVPM